MTKNICLTIVTCHQDTKEKAQKLAAIISDELGIKAQTNIERYDKFEDSYKIKFEFPLETLKNSTEESIIKTDLLCSPWMVYVDVYSKEIELLFNKTNTSKYRKQALNVIIWANWTVIPENFQSFSVKPKNSHPRYSTSPNFE